MDLILSMNYLIEGQTFKFDYISIAFVIIILVAVIIGLKKGFLSALVSLFASLGSLIAAIFLAKPVGAFIETTIIGESINNAVFSWVSSQGEIFTQPFSGEDILIEALNQLGIPEMMHDILLEYLMPLIPETGDVILGELISQSLTSFACLAIAFFVLWIVLVIVFKILGIFAKKLNKVPLVGPLNRILGGVFGFLSGSLICFVVCYLISLLLSTGLEFGATLADWMGLNDDGVWTISKMFYEMNIIQRLLSLII